MTKRAYLSAVVLVLSLLSCEKEDPGNNTNSGYSNGIFITNEGAFGNSNGSISYLNRDSMLLHNDFFYQINDRPLGDVVQSISIYNGRAYIVVNNSQKVEVVKLDDFRSVGVIEGLSYPRHFLGIDQSKGYITNGAMNGVVYVVDLQSLTVSDSIQVGYGPEKMILHQGSVYVANSGGWGQDSTISVINPAKDQLTMTIEVGNNPIAMTVDKKNDIWVLCKGKAVYGSDWSIVEETNSELVKINSNTLEADESIIIGQTGDFYWPTSLSTDIGGGNILFTEAGGLYQMDINSGIQPAVPIIPRSFYGFGVDPFTATIYGLSAGDFSSPGYLYRYQPGGALLDSMAVGIAPNGVAFN